MPKITINPVEANYLRVIYRAHESQKDLTTGLLAESFHVKPASAVDVVNRLVSKGLVVRKGWGKFDFSKKGEALALKLIHNHRVLETYFSYELALDHKTACYEASKIDYLMGDEVVKRFCLKLGYPVRCMHGKEVPHNICRK